MLVLSANPSFAIFGRASGQISEKFRKSWFEPAGPYPCWYPGFFQVVMSGAMPIVQWLLWHLACSAATASAAKYCKSFSKCCTKQAAPSCTLTKRHAHLRCKSPAAEPCRDLLQSPAAEPCKSFAASALLRLNGRLRLD